MSWRSDRKLEKAYDQVISKMNDLFFSPGGIKDLLVAYRVSMSEGDWRHVISRAKVNQAKFAELKSAKDALETLGRDHEAARMLDHMLAAKSFYLYQRLVRFQEPPPENEVDELIAMAADLDAKTTDVRTAQEMLAKRLEEARNSRREHEKRLFR
jgi:hypothetical protein